MLSEYTSVYYIKGLKGVGLERKMYRVLAGRPVFLYGLLDLR